MESLPPWALVRELSLTLILPSLGVSALLLVIVRALVRSAAGRLLGAGAALAGGLAAGNGFRGLLPWWSIEWGWPALFPATLAILVAGIVAALLSPRIGRRRELVLCSVCLGVAAFWLAPGDSPLSLSRLGFFGVLVAASLANLQAIQSISYSRQEGAGLNPSWLPLTITIITIIWGGSAATVLVAAQSARFSEMAMLLAAGLCGLGIAALGAKTEWRPLWVVPAFYYPALMLNGQAGTYSEVPAASFILIALAPCALFSLRWPAVQSWPLWARHVAVPGVLLLPCALGVFLALRAEPLNFSEH